MTRRVIELREWEARDVRLDDTDVTALIAHPQRPAAVEPSWARGFWRLRAQVKVGAVRFEGFDLIVRPKAGLQNVFYLMGIERPGTGGATTRWICWSSMTCSRVLPGCWHTPSSAPSGGADHA
jgi:hypothetical protein